MAKNTIVAANKDLGNDGTKGGIFKGLRHSEGGIPVEVEGGGKVEVETDEPIIVPKAVNANTTVSFDGKKMKPKEVISKINQDYGGVPIKKKGGVIDAKAEIKRLKDIRDKKELGGLLAPNGKKSNLTEQQYKLVRSDAFKKWFGDWENDPKNASKVVDENGEPLVMLHGSNSKHFVFNITNKGGAMGSGIYLTTDKSMASFYGSNVYELFVNIKNPKYVNTRKEDTQMLGGSLIYLQKKGKGVYDGICNEYNIWLAINPNQIKLADGSNTTFDANNNDIRYESGGNISTNEQPIKVKAGSVVVTRGAILNDEKHEYNGEMLTNKEILSKINHDIGGGVEFAKGGKIGNRYVNENDMYFVTESEKESEELEHDKEFLKNYRKNSKNFKLNDCGCNHTKEQAAKGKLLNQNSEYKTIASFDDFYTLSKKEIKEKFNSEFEQGYPIVNFFRNGNELKVEKATGILKNGEQVYFDNEKLEWVKLLKEEGLINALELSKQNLNTNGIVIKSYDKEIIVIAYNTGGQERDLKLYNLNLISNEIATKIDYYKAAEIVSIFNDRIFLEKFDEKKLNEYKKAKHLIICNQNEVIYSSNDNFESGGTITTDYEDEIQKLKQDLEKENLVVEDEVLNDEDTLIVEQKIVEQNTNNNPNYFSEKNVSFNETKKSFGLGGGIEDAENEAKKIWESLTDEQRQQLIQGGVRVMNGLLEEYKQNVIKLESEKSALTERRNKIYEEEKKEQSYQYFNEREQINKQLNTLEVEIRHAKNIEKAFANGGKIVEFEDKKGLLNSNIPSFIEVDTSVISFDEETILADPMPKYIPLMDEPIFKAKGFVFDAIRISKDTYIVAVNGYKENSVQSRADEVTNGKKHQTVAQQGYVLLTLDQLVLTNDYYLTRAKALAQKKADEQTERNEAYYDKLPIEQRERHLNQRNYYSTLPIAVKKKITQQEYEALDLAGKEAFYKPFKKVGAERLTSKLADDRMWVSFHDMYERFLDPTAVQPQPRYANSIVFAYWTKFRDMMQFKIKDIKMQREVDSEQYKKALETSFGDVNTEDLLFAKYGILVKRQDGKKIEPTHIEEIESSWIKVQKCFGNLTEWAKKTNLKISHTNQTYVFASKAIGMYVPKMNTIAVSSKYGYEQFANTFAHEIAHYIDNKLGEQKGKRWLTDDYESTAGILAFEFRRLLNKKTESDYLNATKECFARALQQYFAIENFGENAEMKFSNSPLDKLTFYFNDDNFVNRENFYNVIKPLIEKFLSETGFDGYTPPEKVEQEPIENKTKIEREKIVLNDNTDVGLTKGIDRIRNNRNASTLVEMAMKRGLIPERQYNDFGKNLLHIIATDEKGVAVETAEIISDFMQRANIKIIDDSFERELQEIENLKFEVPIEKPIEDIRLEEIEKNIEESKNEEAEINAIQDPTKRLLILKESLRKKEELFSQKIQEHFDTVRQANGQPLNDKRNGQATLNKWERQNDAIRGIKEGIEKTKRAIEIEEGKIKEVSATKEYLPKQLLDAIDNGTIVQWRKHPNTFFVAGVDKARLVWDDKAKVLVHKYVREITDKDQYKKFAKTYNELSNAIKNNTDVNVKIDEPINKDKVEQQYEQRINEHLENKIETKTQITKHKDYNYEAIKQKFEEFSKLDANIDVLYAAICATLEDTGIDTKQYEQRFTKEYLLDLPSKLPLKNAKLDFNDLPIGEQKIVPIHKGVEEIKNPTIKDELKILTPIVAKEDFRPKMMGVYFDKERENLVATDAHVLVIIKEDRIDKKQILNPKTNTEIHDGSYVQYQDVIPYNNPYRIKLNVQEVYDIANGVERANKFFDGHQQYEIKLAFFVGGDKWLFYTENVIRIFKVLLQFGYKEVEMTLSTPMRGVMVETPKVTCLIMPVLVREDYEKYVTVFNGESLQKEEIDEPILPIEIETNNGFINKDLDRAFENFEDWQISKAKKSNVVSKKEFEINIPDENTEHSQGSVYTYNNTTDRDKDFELLKSKNETKQNIEVFNFETNIKAKNTIALLEEAGKVGTTKVLVKFIPAYEHENHKNLSPHLIELLKQPKTEIFDVIEDATWLIEKLKTHKDVQKIIWYNETENIEVHKPTEVESIAETKPNKVGRKAKETKAAEPTQQQIKETIDGLMVLADMGDKDALETVEGLKLLLD